MGLNILSGGTNTPIPPNPDPRRFEIVRVYPIRPYVCVKVRYHGVTSYEGLKIMVLRESAVGNVLNTARLDPHFTADGYVVARFAPTEDGWKDAIDYCERKIRR